MTTSRALSPITPRRVGAVNAAILLRILLTIAAFAFALALAPALAEERLSLRGDVVATADVLTLGDLVDGVAGPEAARPLFRAPALGESGTIQTRRILDAAAGLDLPRIETDGRQQVSVTRAARRIGAAEIEAAVRQALAAKAGLDVRSLSVVLEGHPSLAVAPDVAAPLTVEELVHDPRARRVSAFVVVSPRPGERRAALRVGGALVEVVEVGVLNRPLARGEVVQAADVAVERRARDSLPQDAESDAAALVGQVARRPLPKGSVLRAGDLARPDLVARGDIVTVAYEIPGMTLTLRGRANESGAMGDTIAVTNPQSKKVLLARVVAVGRVSVAAPAPGPVAAVQHPVSP